MEGIFVTVQSYMFLTNEGTTYAPIDDGIPIETNNLQVLDIILAASPNEAFLELKRNNPNLIDMGFKDVFCLELGKDYNQNRIDFTLIE